MHQHVVEAVRPAIVVLGAVPFLLLIACSNVANLLLVRTSLRERDLAVRTALGGTGRLISQTLLEALLLAAAGALFGIGLAWLGIHQLRVIAPENLPRLETIRIDLTVLAFACLSAFAAAALFGLAPALRALRPDIAQVLRTSARTSGLSGVGMLRTGVVIAEAGLSFVLLVGSGLMFRSFLELQRINPGYDPRGLLTFQLLGGGRAPKPEERAAFQREILDRLRALPGVRQLPPAPRFRSPAASAPSDGDSNLLLPIRPGFRPATFKSSSLAISKRCERR
jgi:putative ABC transport system permease protein